MHEGDNCKFCGLIAVKVADSTHPSGWEWVINHDEKCPREEANAQERYDRGYRDGNRSHAVCDEAAYAADLAYRRGWLDGDRRFDEWFNS